MDGGLDEAGEAVRRAVGGATVETEDVLVEPSVNLAGITYLH